MIKMKIIFLIKQINTILIKILFFKNIYIAVMNESKKIKFKFLLLKAFLMIYHNNFIIFNYKIYIITKSYIM